MMSTRSQLSVHTIVLQVDAVDWMWDPEAGPEASALRDDPKLERAALKYFRKARKLPFLTQPPSAGQVVVPTLDFFGRKPPKTRQNSKGEVELVELSELEDESEDELPEGQWQAPAEEGEEEGAQGTGEDAAGVVQGGGAHAGGNTGAGSSKGRAKGRAGGDGNDTDPEADLPNDPEDRASSATDRLRNSMARAVVMAHTLLGDPAKVTQAAKPAARRMYYKWLDRKAMSLLLDCKIWDGTGFRKENRRYFEFPHVVSQLLFYYIYIFRA